MRCDKCIYWVRHSAGAECPSCKRAAPASSVGESCPACAATHPHLKAKYKKVKRPTGECRRCTPIPSIDAYRGQVAAPITTEDFYCFEFREKKAAKGSAKAKKAENK